MFFSLLVFQSFSLSELSLGGNWIDFLILLVLAYYVSEAWRIGFWIILADFLGFLLSLLIGLWGYSYVADILKTSFSLPHSVSNALGFLFTAGISEAIIGFILINFIRKIPYKFWKKPWNNIAATFPALGQGIILISFILTLIVGLPLSPKLKNDVTSSRIGSVLVRETSGLEAKLNQIFGGLVEDSLTYLTVKPGSTAVVPIETEVQELTVDEARETEMFNLVNEERKKRGINELSLRVELTPVARAHAKDMWERQYFGHVSPDGEDIGDRLDKANVSYHLAGENLALAPTLATAHNGLMNSEGHRRNILDPEFKRLGIGVIDNGIYGKMFVQIFTD